MKETTTIWIWSHESGKWSKLRQVPVEHSADWLRLYQRDCPDYFFKLGKRIPTAAPISRRA